MRRVIACLIASSMGSTGLHAQHAVPTFRVVLAPSFAAVSDTTLQVSYAVRFLSSAHDSLDEFAVLSDVPVRHVRAPSIPARSAYVDTHEGELHVATWGWLGVHPHSGAMASLSYQATGIPGIVTYRLMRYVPAREAGPGEIDDSNPTLANFTTTDADQVVGKTVGVVPPPVDRSLAGVTTWLRGQASQACALGWIDNAGVCNSILTKLDHGSFAALRNELHAQRGKHVSEEGYALLSRTVAHLVQRSTP